MLRKLARLGGAIIDGSPIDDEGGGTGEMRNGRRRRASAALLVAMLALPGLAAAAVRHAFVTSSSGTGDFSLWPGDLDGGLTGLAAANKICQNSAASSVIPAISGAASTFRAWVSTGATDAFCNVLGFTGTAASDCGGAFTNQVRGPWARPDGVAWAGTLDEMTSESAIYSQLEFDQNGAEIVSETYHWTGSEADGAGTTDDCNGWTAGASVDGTYGRAPDSAGASWSHWGQFVCNTGARLLCLEGAAGDPVTVDQGPGALAFVTSATGKGNPALWPQSGGTSGLAGADAICQTLAGNGHLPSPASFVAWLSTGSVDAIGRLTTNGPFRRVDGARLATNKTTLVDDFREHPLHQTESGGYVGYRRVFTGTSWNGLKTGLDCDEWTNSVSGTATAGQAVIEAHNWSEDVSAAACNASLSLYCLSNAITIFWNGFEASDPAWSATAGMP